MEGEQNATEEFLKTSGMGVDVADEGLAFHWLAEKLGTEGLSGIFKKDGKIVYTPRINESGYVDLTENEKKEIALGSMSSAQIQPVNSFTMMAKISENYTPYKMNKDRTKARYPEFPQIVCNMILNNHDAASNLRPLLGVTHVPMPRKDGSILDTPGYDDQTGFLYLPTIEVPKVSANPSRQQVNEAVELIRGTLSDFSWLSEHDEVNYIGLLLTPLLRQICPPPYKLGVIMARQPGSGKSFLAKILRIIHDGELRSSMPEGDTELAKQISGILNYTTAPVITWDNVTGQVKSALLDGLLTTDRLSDRLLGSTNNTSMTNDRLWTMTGNNANLGGDLKRRAVWITIDPKCPNPEARTDFKIKDLTNYVQRNRPQLLHALLTLISYWHSQGMHYTLSSSDDYAKWSAITREILQLAGIPGTFDHQDSKQQQQNTDSDDWEQFLSFVEAHCGTGPENSFTAPSLLGNGKIANDLTDVLPGDLADRAAKMFGDLKPLSRSLGRWFMNHNGRWAGNLAIRENGKDSKKNKKWYIDRFE